MTFEEAMKRLDEIIRLLEDSSTSLDQSVELFQEGITLTKFCQDKITQVEEKVSKIMINGQFEDYKTEE